MNIPSATIGLPLVSANARAEIRGEVSGGVAAVHLDIGACGCVGVWKLKKCWCNPTDWLPVNVYKKVKRNLKPFIMWGVALSLYTYYTHS